MCLLPVPDIQADVAYVRARVFRSPALLLRFCLQGFYLRRKEGRKEGTCLFDINIKHNTEIYIGKIISGDSH